MSALGQGSLPEAGTRETDKKQLLEEEETIWWEDGGWAGQACQNHVITNTEVAVRHRMLKSFPGSRRGGGAHDKPLNSYLRKQIVLSPNLILLTSLQPEQCLAWAHGLAHSNSGLLPL